MAATTIITRGVLALFVVASFASAQNCGGIVNTGVSPSGMLTSPGYPDHYPGDATCTWTIQAPQGEKIELQFWDFDVTGSDGCAGDYVSVTTSLDGEEQRYCGSVQPGVLVSQAETLQLTFASNAQGSCRGFNASYQVKEELLSCGAKTSDLEFTFVSPSYPEGVGNDSLECSVTVDHGCDSPICQLRLDFDDFQLQPPYWGNCKYDKFYAESATPLPTLCGVNNGSHMYINVEGRSKTDLTFLLGQLEYYLYHCYDIYGPIVDNEKGIPEDIPHLRRARRDLRPTPPTMRRHDFQEQEFFPQPQGSFVEHMDGDGDQRQLPGSSSSSSAPLDNNAFEVTTHGDVTVALYNYKDADLITFPTRRAWKVRVTQIPCDCPKSRYPKAPEGCLQYYEGLTGEFKSFNFEGVGCYSEDRWCDFSSIRHVSDCDIRVGYTGHYNDLDYSICVEPESGFCGIQYQQIGPYGFSLSNITSYNDESAVPTAEFGDMGCMADYFWVPGAENDHGVDTYERFCGTKLGTARKWGTVTSFSKPFHVRMVTDSDEYSLVTDYMNRGFHIAYSQIPCKLSG